MPFLMVCLVGLLVSVDASPVSSPMIEGQVRLSNGSPVAGAQVVLFDVADLRRGPVGQATTDETGQFALPLAAGGAFML
ncbi:MAG: carboxypeptidase regulatory-like domain-containing protein, partial [Candidatus Latescibacteria bacterium]|nr:carboxypeptidase regulatory-like domain-containing protein [Candidatus Latescibacterota bacterium]